ncbi:MAG: hypothetical protein Kow0069_27590 [Promethearchaeota archaeon]
MDPSERAYLTRKVLCRCPSCGTTITGGHLFERPEDVPGRPFVATYCHRGEASDGELHAVTMFVDANFAVRSVEKSDLLRISS